MQIRNAGKVIFISRARISLAAQPRLSGLGTRRDTMPSAVSGDQWQHADWHLAHCNYATGTGYRARMNQFRVLHECGHAQERNQRHDSWAVYSTYSRCFWTSRSRSLSCGRREASKEEQTLIVQTRSLSGRMIVVYPGGPQLDQLLILQGAHNAS